MGTDGIPSRGSNVLAGVKSTNTLDIVQRSPLHDYFPCNLSVPSMNI